MAFSGFRVRNNSTQAIASSTFVKVSYQTVTFDTESMFDETTNYDYEIPTSWDGKWAQFHCGARMNAAEYGIIRILKNGSERARNVFDGGGTLNASTTCSTRPIQVTGGDLFTVEIFIVGGGTLANDPRCFFSGHLIDPFDGFLVHNSGSPSNKVLIPTATEVTMDYQFQDIDTTGGWISSPGEVWEVPSGYDGKHMTFHTGIYADTSNEACDCEVQRQVGGSGDWLPVAGQRMDVFNLFTGFTLDTGPVLLSAGDLFRVRIYTGLGFETRDDKRTHFAGWVVGV